MRSVEGCRGPYGMKRALLIVLDSVGIGHAPDAEEFGDCGANTVGHIRERVSGLELPFLDACGLSHCEALAAGDIVPNRKTKLAWGCLTELSAGKDTTTGHWEIAGAPLEKPFAVFESFPPEVVAELEEKCGVAFIGNYAQSGTVILDELGEEHLDTGRLILYTSSDSVLQIAAHEEAIPLQRLYRICEAAREIADRERIGRVIARPFLGEPGHFQRTPNRKDFSFAPPRTVLNGVCDEGVHTVGIGKIHDIFAGSGIAESFPTKSNREGMDCIAKLWKEEGGRNALYFANLVDFDMLYGHRRDPQGYAGALIEFDSWLGEFLPMFQGSAAAEDSLLIITADHGNDPAWPGTDHTRERVPLLVGGQFAPGCLGVRESFADIAASLAEFFGAPPWQTGQSFLPHN